MKGLFLASLSFFCVTAIYGQVLEPEEIYQKTVNSTVTIETGTSLGSGFFVFPNIIATNYHVIEEASEAWIVPSQSKQRFKIDGYVAVDKSIDLALLKVSGVNGSPISFEQATVVPGQRVYAIGSPKGLPATISDGIVSAIRDFNGYSLIQITAPISPGSSGGPVLNNRGKLVGISVMQMRDGQNLNFAVPRSSLEMLIALRQPQAQSLVSLARSSAFGANSPSTAAYSASGRQFIRERIKGWGECKNVAICQNGAAIALYGKNGYAYDGSVPTRMVARLKELNAKNELIDDVQLTEEGRWLIQWGNNGYSSEGLPQSLLTKMSDYNDKGDVIYSISFNDAGDWVIVTKASYAASSDRLLAYIKEGAQKYGMVWSAHLTSKAMVVCYESGFKFIGAVPDTLKKKISETRLDVFRIKFLDDGSYFLADRKGSYAYNM